jgi:3-deoxy-D-manno-octulosonic-acid transferase
MIYQLLIRLLAPILILITAYESVIKKGKWRFFKQRLGFGYSAVENQDSYKTLWIHCASVGEINAVLPLIKKLQIDWPNYRTVVTTNTSTGAGFLNQQLPKITHHYCPIDWPFAIDNYIKAVKPQKLFIVETEIWPNLFETCYQSQIPITVINGRISERTLIAPTWLKTAYQQALFRVSQILARSIVDADRFVQLGADIHKVTHLGNLKYAQFENLKQQNNPIAKDFVLAASTHQDEELNIVKIWHKLKRNELLILAPRHPKRCSQIERELKSLKINYTLSSSDQALENDSEILLIDRIGILAPLFAHAKLIIMGGSFISRGGHNILEPAAYGKAIITGPHMHNFNTEMKALLEAKAIVQCSDYAVLEEQIEQLIDSPESRSSIGHKARDHVQSQANILNIYMQHLQP